MDNGRTKGFTLVELLMVISIVALLASIVLASLNTARDKGRVGAGRQFEANVYHAEADQAIGLWDLNECTGSTTADRTGSLASAVLTNGPSWSANTPTGTGCSLSFDGIDDYAIAPAMSGFDGTKITIAAWAKKGANPSTYTQIAGDSAAQGAIYMAANGAVFGQFAILGGTSQVVIDTNWHYLVTTWENGDYIKLYVDGALVGRSPSTYTGTLASFPAVWMARYTGGTYFTGLIDNVRIFAKSLVASEVQKLYAEGLPSHPFAVK